MSASNDRMIQVPASLIERALMLRGLNYQPAQEVHTALRACLDQPTEPVPHPPTRKQIADYSELRADLATMARQERTPDHWAIGRNQRTARSALTAIDTLLALLQNGADREEQIRADERQQWAAYFENADASVGSVPFTYALAAEMLRGQKPFGVAQGVQNGADR